MYEISQVDQDPDTSLLRRFEFEYLAHKHLLQASSENPVSLAIFRFDVESLSAEKKLELSLGWSMKKIAEVLRFGSGNAYALARLDRLSILALLPYDSAQVCQYAEALRSSVKDFFHEINPESEKTVSVGVITATMPVQIESLLHDAGLCVTAAKAWGRDQVCSWEQLVQKSISLGIPLNLLTMEYQIRVDAEEMASNVAFQTRRTILDYIEKSETDPLTGLHNRGYFDKRMLREISNAHEKGRSLVYAIIDADDFGDINNKNDYATGDAALRIIADVLRQEIRSTDWIARYGGEEFVIVMPDTELNDGIEVAERIRQAISTRSVPGIQNESIKLTVCAGVVRLEKNEEKVDDLTKRASLAIHIAKAQEGKNTIAYQDLTQPEQFLIKERK